MEDVCTNVALQSSESEKARQSDKGDKPDEPRKSCVIQKVFKLSSSERV
jgi:hypothetical protein